MLGRGVAGVANPLNSVASEISAADLAVGNLESPVARGKLPAHRGESELHGYILDAPPSAAQQLQAAGFDVIGLANNHAYDRGAVRLMETASALRRLGITPVGTELAEITTIKLKGIPLAILAFNAIPVPRIPEALWKRERAIEAISVADRSGAVVIVLMHWGDEYSPRIEFGQETTAHMLADAGADLVIGAHPHVLQTTQVFFRDSSPPTFVAYSLGNFVFDQEMEEVAKSAALRVKVDRAGIAAVEAVGLISGRKPRWAKKIKVQNGPTLDASLDQINPQPPWLERLIPKGEQEWFECDMNTCRETAGYTWKTPRPPNEIDLTGDGDEEQIRMNAGRLVITNGREQVWISPELWRIYDFDVGDPNDDGRGEVVVVFEKPDMKAQPPGKVASHPFLIGYRGGQYREVWGGSAVSDPIREIALGDVDRDGRQDLIVLEEDCSNIDEPSSTTAGCEQIAVSVWTWNGWGFSRLWRSAPSRYHTLSVVSTDHGDVISVVRSW